MDPIDVTNLNTSLPQTDPAQRRFFLVAAVVYTLLLFYGTLYPLSELEFVNQSPFNLDNFKWPDHTPWSDIVTNLLVYFPLGLLLYLSFSYAGTYTKQVIVITCIGTLISVSLEFIQIFLPSRITSVVDILLNSLGTFAGASIASLIQNNPLIHKFIINHKQKWFASDSLTQVGLAAIVFWVVSQIFPLVPSLDIGNLRQGISPVWHTLNDLSSFKVWQFFSYFFYLSTIALLLKSVTKNAAINLMGVALFLGLVLFLKIPVVTRQLSLEAFSGLFASLALIPILFSFKQDARLKLSATFLLLGFLIDSLHAGHGTNATLQTMNWIPFKGQMVNLTGLTDITSSIWPFVALAYIAMVVKPNKQIQILLIGTLIAGIGTFTIEWLQQSLAGRYSDITDVVLATTAFFATCLYQIKQANNESL